jgi:subfamily B ATP-binding cassette protein MsbA
VLRNVSFSVERGKVVALVGPSGAGKSTLMDLVCRFYDPQDGAVEIDDVDIRNISRASLLQHIAIVTQDTFLFNTSIAENIRYGRREATQAEIESAARAANIHDFIAGLPAGYNTVIGERGAKLSGGQRQRLAIARALLKNPAILFLDEATSALDSESEQVVQEALATLMKGRTSLVIAHRLSTIHNADLIVVLENGEVVEEGKHEELLATGKLYARLYGMQFKDVDMPQ